MPLAPGSRSVVRSEQGKNDGRSSETTGRACVLTTRVEGVQARDTCEAGGPTDPCETSALTKRDDICDSVVDRKSQ